MKFVHLGDLHIGKQLNYFDLLQEQEFVLTQILGFCKKENIHTIVIAGDVYDKSSPSAAAVTLFSKFLSQLKSLNITAIIIAGNHDSPERLDYAKELLESENIYICGSYKKGQKPVVIKDEFGEVYFYQIPHITANNVRIEFELDECDDFDNAFSIALKGMNVDFSKRNVLISHQFVYSDKSEPIECDSEKKYIGGSRRINSDLLKDFDYVALGHLHRAQYVGEKNIRYCGSPLKYSISEANYNKSFYVVELSDKGNIDITIQPITALHDLREIKGSFADIMALATSDDYVSIELSDKEIIPNANYKLATIFPNYLRIVNYTGTMEFVNNMEETEILIGKLSVGELFEYYAKTVVGKELSEKQKEFVTEIEKELAE